MSEVKGPRAIEGSRIDRRELDDFADRLRENCAPWAGPSAEPHQCPSPERLWEAAAGELAPAKTVRLIDHLALCTQCAAAYRLAVEMQTSLETSGRGSARRSSVSPWRQWMAVAAALLLVAFGLTIWQSVLQPDPVPAMRGRARPVIEFSVPENAPLPAQAFTLQWELAQDALYYDVDVFADNDLRVLAQERQLRRTSFTVPLSRLEGIPEGTSVHWKVEAYLADGSRQSYTHMTRLRR